MLLNNDTYCNTSYTNLNMERRKVDDHDLYGTSIRFLILSTKYGVKNNNMLLNIIHQIYNEYENYKIIREK